MHSASRPADRSPGRRQVAARDAALNNDSARAAGRASAPRDESAGGPQARARARPASPSQRGSDSREPARDRGTRREADKARERLSLSSPKRRCWTRRGTRSMPRSSLVRSRAAHQASCSQRRIGVYFTQCLFFRLLPKLDVVGSSPIARSLEVLKFEPVAVAAIRTGPGDFFLGPIRPLIFAANRAFCSSVRPATSASRSTAVGFAEAPATPAARSFPLGAARAPRRSARRTFAASVRSSSVCRSW